MDPRPRSLRFTVAIAAAVAALSCRSGGGEASGTPVTSGAQGVPGLAPRADLALLDVTLGADGRSSATIEFEEPGSTGHAREQRSFPVSGGGVSALERVASLARADRASVQITRAGVDGRDEVSRLGVLPLGELVAADAALRRAVSNGGAPGVDAAFIEFCERTLLVRRGGDRAWGTQLDGAAWWMGRCVALRGDDPVVRALPALLVELYRLEARGSDGSAPDPVSDPPSASGLEPTPWALPRMLALRSRMGADAFRDGLRAFVDEHRGGPPVGRDEWVAAMEAAAPGVAAGFAQVWLQGPGRPRIRVQTRFDASRERLLVRVDQVHEVDSDTPAAFPFELVLETTLPGSSPAMHRFAVERRRHLFEIAVETEPMTFRVDPEAHLEGLVDIESETGGDAVRPATSPAETSPGGGG